MNAHEPYGGDTDDLDTFANEGDDGVPFVDGSLEGERRSAKGPDGKLEEMIESKEGEVYYLMQGNEGPYYKVTP
jgi:hypothetical protein